MPVKGTNTSSCRNFCLPLFFFFLILFISIFAEILEDPNQSWKNSAKYFGLPLDLKTKELKIETIQKNSAHINTCIF